MLQRLEAKEESGYNVAPGTEKRYHAIIEIPDFDRRTGARRSTPRIQTFGIKEWKDALHNLRKLGHNITVLHDGAAWVAANADAVKKQGIAKAEENKAAAEKAQQAAIDAAVAAALAKQAEENKAPVAPKKTAKDL